MGNANGQEADPMVDGVLPWLDQDIQENPHKLRPVTQPMLNRIDGLVGEVEVDMSVPLSPADE